MQPSNFSLRCWWTQEVFATILIFVSFFLRTLLIPWCLDVPVLHASGVSNCYVFKSRLQEYAQKKGLPTPVYETIKEGPSHEPSFRSTVIVKNVRYDSLPGFFNRKAAEQSAAEVALVELAKSDEVNECISQPVVSLSNSLTKSVLKARFMIVLWS